MPATPRARRALGTDTLHALAQTVRAARERNGWTLAQLAERSGVSGGMLVQIERARTNPSIGTLIRISDAFGVGVWQLFAPPEDALRHATRGEALALWRSRRGGVARLLVGSSSPQPIEWWEWSLAPGDVYAAPAHFDTTVEAIHVRRGTLTLIIGTRRVPVRAGESVVARMNQRHQYRNDTRRRVEMSMVVVDPRRG